MQPKPNDTVVDPVCGTGGFLLAAHDYMAAQASSKKNNVISKNTPYAVNDIVDSVVRLCATCPPARMNLYLHGIGGDECPITVNDALAKEVADDRVDRVLANPPFGKKSFVSSPASGAPAQPFAQPSETVRKNLLERCLPLIDHYTLHQAACR